MPPLLVRILGVVAGVAVAMGIVLLVDGAAHRLSPPPAGLDTSDPDAVRAALARTPLAALALMVLGWTVAAGVGAFVGSRIDPRRQPGPGLVVAGVFLAATIANLAMLPHPAWMWVGPLVLVPLAGWFGARAGSRAHLATEGHA